MSIWMMSAFFAVVAISDLLVPIQLHLAATVQNIGWIYVVVCRAFAIFHIIFRLMESPLTIQRSISKTGQWDF